MKRQANNNTASVRDNGTEPNIIDLLTPEQLDRLDHSIQQADKGELIPHEEVMRKTREKISNYRNNTK